MPQVTITLSLFPPDLGWLTVAVLTVILYLVYRTGHLRGRMRKHSIRVERLAAAVVRLNKRLCEQKAALVLSRAGRVAQMPVEFTSQYDEDVYLWDLFGGKLDGFYIEVGAFDGYRYSVTYPFEAVGWTGVLVEAIPERFRECVARRPNSQVAHAALSRRGSSGTTTFTVLQSKRGDAATEMLSHRTPSGWKAKSASQTRSVPKKVTVPLSTMDAVLLSASPPVPTGDDGRWIDFVIIDVEGAEPDLLDGFDIERFRPRVLLIEDMAPRNTSGVSAFMARRHYVNVGRVGVSSVFIRSDETELIARARSIGDGR